MRNFYFAAIIISSIFSDIFANEYGVMFISVGGGYPLGLVNKLNSGFENAYGETSNLFSNNSTTSLTKTYSAGSFAINLGIGNKDISSMPDNSLKWFGMLGYSYHGTGETKWSDNFSDGTNNYSLSVSGKYSMHDIRLMPVLWWPYSDRRACGLGAGAVYSIVNYSQNMDNKIPNSPQLPSISEINSGITWNIYGFWQLFSFGGIEVSSSGSNLFYVGLFICGVEFSQLK